MNFDQCDLELFRRMIHTTLYVQQKSVQVLLSDMPLHRWWKQHGAFVSTLPRRIGKSKMLLRLARKFESSEQREPYVVVTNTVVTKDHLVKSGINRLCVYAYYEIENALKGKLNPAELHLMIDEYTQFGSSLDIILSYPWKTVTMVGTLR